MKAITRLAATGLAVAALCVPAAAVAGNGHGNGNGGGEQSQGYGQQSPPQQQSESGLQPQSGYSPAPAAQTSGRGNGGGQSPQHQQQAPAHQPAATASHGNRGGAQSKQSPTSASQPASGGSNSRGVKPSNKTQHNTYAKASSDKTKQYGNGQTAGQIATKKGYGSATLHGPGNSQPHKTSCPPKHEVDVHALKSGGCTIGNTFQGAVAAQHAKSHPVHAPAARRPIKPTNGVAQPGAVQAAHHESKQARIVSGNAHGGVAEETNEKVTICHATGSMTNPYVEITISKEGWLNGHSKHADDLFPVPAGGCPQPVQAPAQTAPAPSTSATSAGTVCRTGTVSMGPVGVWHHTGSKKNPYVYITPSANSAHYSKHTDDIVVMGETASEAGSGSSSCVAAPSPAPVLSATCVTGTATQVLVPIGVWHHTGSKKNPYVYITPSANSAHYSKHTDDIVVWGVASTKTGSDGQECTTVTPVSASPSTPPATPGATSSSPIDTTTTETTTSSKTTAVITTTAAAGVAGTMTTPTEQSGAPATARPSSGIAGATASSLSPSATGVAGATASHAAPATTHRGVLGTLAHGTLPYTGFPLWLASLIAILVIAAGVALARTRRNPADPMV